MIKPLVLHHTAQYEDNDMSSSPLFPSSFPLPHCFPHYTLPLPPPSFPPSPSPFPFLLFNLIFYYLFSFLQTVDPLLSPGPLTQSGSTWVRTMGTSTWCKWKVLLSLATASTGTMLLTCEYTTVATIPKLRNVHIPRCLSFVYSARLKH